MKTFFVTVMSPKPRGKPHINKFVVPTDTKDSAIAIVKSYHPVGSRGWDKAATFSVIEIPMFAAFSV